MLSFFKSLKLNKLWLTKKISYQQVLRFLKLGTVFSLALFTVNLFLNVIFELPYNATAPTDAFFVLGGSINREIYVAQLAKQNPQLPVIISSGSEEPCILLVFRRSQAPINRVLLENCANSTFGNLFFTLPILERWHVRKVTVITSKSHLPRAKLLSYVLLGSHGISVDLKIAPEKGVPGNQEFWLKTAIDLVRSLGWALLSQGIKPSCSSLQRLEDVDLSAWKTQGFSCERQAELEY